MKKLTAVEREDYSQCKTPENLTPNALIPAAAWVALIVIVALISCIMTVR